MILFSSFRTFESDRPLKKIILNHQKSMLGNTCRLPLLDPVAVFQGHCWERCFGEREKRVQGKSTKSSSIPQRLSVLVRTPARVNPGLLLKNRNWRVRNKKAFYFLASSCWVSSGSLSGVSFTSQLWLQQEKRKSRVYRPPIFSRIFRI